MKKKMDSEKEREEKKSRIKFEGFEFVSIIYLNKLACFKLI